MSVAEGDRMVRTLLIAGAVLPLLATSARADERFGIEAGVGFNVGAVDDDYESRLTQFGYTHDAFMAGVSGHYDVAATWRAHKHVELALAMARLDADSYTRDDTVPTTFSWDTHAATAIVRVLAPTENERAALYAEAGAGLAWVTSDYSKGPMANDHETQLGRALTFGVGARAMITRKVGLVFDIRQTWAPVLHNLYGETHDVGGRTFELGLRVAF
jgi:hypothetical protein